MPFNARRERRLLEAARRDGDEEMYFDDLREAIEEGAYTASAGDFSIREIFEEFVDDGREIVSSWSPRALANNQGVMLQEAAVDTASFANINGQIMYSTVLDEFNNPAFIADQLTTTIPTQFDGEKIPGISGIGDEVDEVFEGHDYPTAGVTEDWVETPTTKKHGFIIEVTKEEVFFDRTGLILRRAGNVSQWLAINKEKRVLDVCLGQTDAYRRKGSSTIATYGDNSGDHDWDNLAATNALEDWTDIENVLVLFDGITDPNTGEPVVLMPNTIVVPSALLMTARRVVSATEIREVTNTNTTSLSPNPLNNPLLGGQPYNIVSSQYVKNRTSSDTTWFFGDFVAAFAYMENWPISVVQAPPNNEAEFRRDVVAGWKVSERGVPAVIEPRKVAKATA